MPRHSCKSSTSSTSPMSKESQEYNTHDDDDIQKLVDAEIKNINKTVSDETQRQHYKANLETVHRLIKEIEILRTIKASNDLRIVC